MKSKSLEAGISENLAQLQSRYVQVPLSESPFSSKDLHLGLKPLGGRPSDEVWDHIL